MKIALALQSIIHAKSACEFVIKQPQQGDPGPYEATESIAVRQPKVIKHKALSLLQLFMNTAPGAVTGFRFSSKVVVSSLK